MAHFRNDLSEAITANFRGNFVFRLLNRTLSIHQLPVQLLHLISLCLKIWVIVLWFRKVSHRRPTGEKKQNSYEKRSDIR